METALRWEMGFLTENSYWRETGGGLGISRAREMGFGE